MDSFLTIILGGFDDILSFENDILSSVFEFVFDLLFGWINLPPFPVELESSLNAFLDLIFDNASLLGFFVRPQTLNILIPALVGFTIFRFILKFVHFAVDKLKIFGRTI